MQVLLCACIFLEVGPWRSLPLRTDTTLDSAWNKFDADATGLRQAIGLASKLSVLGRGETGTVQNLRPSMAGSASQ